jgi:peptidoglycan/xylan/chitin deacetylase (PgdA/CDA1 family)
MIGGPRLPILVYHHFSEERDDRLTVSRGKFERQLQYLRDKGYRSIRLSELMYQEHVSAQRRVVITFDDGYRSVAHIAVPLLARYGFSATCFLPVAHIGADNAWDGGGTPLMSADTLRALPSEQIELALHSWRHENYCFKSGDDIARDLALCRHRLDVLGIPYQPMFAYPYGKVPKDKRRREQVTTALRNAGIRIACRVGNRLNRLPVRDALMLTRTNVRGDEPHWKFCIKVALGRSKLL